MDSSYDSAGLDEETARVLRSLFDRRNEADYIGGPVTAEDADRAIMDAETFVRAVEAWLAGRS